MKILHDIYDQLKNRYDLTLTRTSAFGDRFSIDVPVLYGQRGEDAFFLYLDGENEEDMVFSVTYVNPYGKDGEDRIRHTHSHPYRISCAIEDIEIFMHFPYVLTEAHRYCTNNRPMLQKGKCCGCFYCLNIYSTDKITDWIPDSQGTARCPHCGIDSVLPDNAGYPITEGFLKDMKRRWFETGTTSDGKLIFPEDI